MRTAVRLCKEIAKPHPPNFAEDLQQAPGGRHFEIPELATGEGHFTSKVSMDLKKLAVRHPKVAGATEREESS
jgi:hypothetical protein